MSDLKNHPILMKIRDNLRVTKVVCTRSVKGRGGDNYVGFSAAWDSIQDDAGGAASLMGTQSESETAISQSQIGMTLREAKLAALVLGMQADIAAHNHAAASGNIASGQRDQAIQAIKGNYSRLIVEALENGNGERNGG